jgi:desampylase
LKVVLPAALCGQILAAARAAHPNECCGLVEGVWDNALMRVTALHPARNLSDDRARFAIDPADHIAAQKAARAGGRSIVGCYHSHPHGRTEPSATDLAGAGEENFLWLIAAGEELNAFIYLRGKFTGADWVTSES